MAEPIPANGNVEVYVARSLSVATSHVRPFGLVIPDYDNWNDYGRGYFATLHIFNSGEGHQVFHLKIMFRDTLRSATALDKILSSYNSDAVPIDSIDIPFVSLLPESSDYQKIIRDLGFDIGVSLLRKIADANVVRAEAVNTAALQLIDSEDFHIGVLRSSDAYDAFHRGSRHLRPSPAVEVEDISGSYILTASLPNADNQHVVEFDFVTNSIFRDRACVLIGKNGVGKTQLLRAAIDSCIQGIAGPSFEPSLKSSRVLVFSSVPTDPFPRIIPAWKGIDYAYFAVNASSSDNPASLLGALLNCWWDRPSPLQTGEKLSRHDLFIKLLKAIGIEQRLYLPIRDAADSEELPHVIELNGRSFFPFHRSLNELNRLRLNHRIDWQSWPEVLNDKMEARSLSSGEHALLRLISQMVSSIERGSLLLLDEPETHLHPNYVSDMMTILHELLNATKSVAIIATHSSYIVREVGRDRVNVVAVNGREAECTRPRMQTFGSSIDNISHFIFGDSNLQHRFQTTLKNWLETDAKGLTIETILSEFGSQLNSEALSYIARLLRDQDSKN